MVDARVQANFVEDRDASFLDIYTNGQLLYSERRAPMAQES